MIKHKRQKKVWVKVLLRPKYVTYQCPNCGKKVLLDYDQFETEMGEEYWGDWIWHEIECQVCSEKFKICGVEAD